MTFPDFYLKKFFSVFVFVSCSFRVAAAEKGQKKPRDVKSRGATKKGGVLFNIVGGMVREFVVRTVCHVVQLFRVAVMQRIPNVPHGLPKILLCLFGFKPDFDFRRKGRQFTISAGVP